MLGAFRDRTDGWFQIQLSGMNVDFLPGIYRAKAGNRMLRIRNSQLAAQSGRGNTRLIIRDVRDLPVYDLRIRHRPQQIADQAIELRVGDQVRGLLITQRAP
jgi:hypothetical protein